MVAITYSVGGVAARKGGARAPRQQQNFITRALVALLESRLRQAHREIAQHAHLFERHPATQASQLKAKA